MTIGFTGIPEVFPMGGLNKIVNLGRGIEECVASSFESFWNSGLPSLLMTQTNEVVGYTDTGYLECDLDVALAKFIQERTGIPEQGFEIGKMLISVDFKNRQISMAMPFDGGKRYAIGAIKFKVMPAEKQGCAAQKESKR